MANIQISGLVEDTSINDTDVFAKENAGGTITKKITWANVKATLKTYLDTLYVSLSSFVYSSSMRTVSFVDTMSQSELQSAIDNTNHYVAPGETLVFQFADGTYTLNTALTFSGFFGGGNVRIKGNSSDGASSTQSVVLDTSATTPSNVIFLNNNNVHVRVENIEINVSTSSAENYGILANESNAYVYFFRCVAVGNSTANGRGIYLNCPSYVKECYFSNIKTGIFVANGINATSDNNQSFGTVPVYGIWDYTGILFTIGANQPTGSTSNVLVSTGVEY